MSLKIYGHPFSSYYQKALIAFYENDVPFEFVMLDGSEPANSDFGALWPIRRFPLLVDGDRPVPEASMIIEYLGVHYPGPVRLIPEDTQAALDVRMMDRFFDNYVSTPQGKIVFNAMRAEADRDPYGVSGARAMLDTAYAWLDKRMADLPAPGEGALRACRCIGW